MINMYAFTYPAAVKELSSDGYILVKIGDSHREAETRMDEQGSSAEWEGKLTVGIWNNLQKIDRDYRVHEILAELGLHHKTTGKGWEWFKIPGVDIKEAFDYIDTVIADLEGAPVRPLVTLRKIQQQLLDRAMEIFATCSDAASLIANLCPRFGKTIWALMLFNRVTEKYGNKVMLLPAYWLSVHSSFKDELKKYKDFEDIRYIDINDPDADSRAREYLKEGKRIIVPISLHCDIKEWKVKHQWVSDIPNEEIFVFADEGDFGTHTDNQVAKLDFLFNQYP